MVCICALVAASSAGTMNKKRGIYGSPEADAMNNYVVDQIGFNNNDASNGGFDSGSQYNDYSSGNNHIESSSHSDFHPSPRESTFNADSYSSAPQSNYNNNAPAPMSSYINFPPNDNNNQYDHQGSNGGFSQDYSSSASAGPSFNAAPAQNYLPPAQNYLPPGQNLDRPHESVKTRHSESTEKGRFPVQVPRTIVKTIHVEHPVPQVKTFIII